MIACYGDALIDLFALPPGAEIDEATSFDPHIGGSTCNVAIVASRAGASVRFIGAVGDDRWADRLRRALVAEGIDTRALATVDATRTPVTFITTRPDGTRAFLSYRAGGADGAMTPGHLVYDALDGVEWLHLASSSLRAEPRASTTREVLARAEARGVRVSLDLNVRPGLWASKDALRGAIDALCKRASLVKASEEDLALLGLAPSLEALARLAPSAACVLTRAERGASARIGATELNVAAPRVALVDATGAGDAFVGALLAGIDREERDPLAIDAARWEALLALACRAGGACVTSVGATKSVHRGLFSGMVDGETS
ncbi:MAG: carbohydrate kinase [Myxococcales bacterium]|nr:carbohydrate kinase [Myxococcales bacterium]